MNDLLNGAIGAVAVFLLKWAAEWAYRFVFVDRVPAYEVRCARELADSRDEDIDELRAANGKLREENFEWRNKVSELEIRLGM